MHASWNTKRLYTEAGQRMAAVVLSDNEVAFADVDRGIDGIMEGSFGGMSEMRLCCSVMELYDHNSYRYPQNEAERDGIAKARDLAGEVASIKTGFPYWCERLQVEDLALFAGESQATIPEEAFSRLCVVKGALVADTSGKWPTFGDEIFDDEDRLVGIRCTLTPAARAYAEKFAAPSVDDVNSRAGGVGPG